MTRKSFLVTAFLVRSIHYFKDQSVMLLILIGTTAMANSVSKLVHAVRVRGGPSGPNHSPFKAKPRSHHV